MRHKLWFKLLIGFVLSIVLMFVILNTYGVNRIQDKLLQEKKTDLYDEAASLSTKYMDSYYNQETTFTEMIYQLQLMDSILNARIWIVNAEGYIVSDTRAPLNRRQAINVLEAFPDFLNYTFSENTVMPGILSEASLSVVVPVVNNFKTRGYVVLHSPLSEVYKETIFFVDTINIALIIFALILALCLIYLYYL